jgi:hypothetical protein
MAAYRRALALAEGQREPDGDTIDNLLHWMGTYELTLGHGDAGMDHLRRSIRIRSEVVDASHPGLLSSRLALARALAERGNEAEAIEQTEMILEHGGGAGLAGMVTRDAIGLRLSLETGAQGG